MQNKIRKIMKSAGIGLTAAVLLLLFATTQGMATELDTAQNIVATNAAGLYETNEDSATITTTISTSSGAINLGANAVNSLTNTGTGAATAVIINHTSTGVAASVLSFLGDIVVSGHATNSIAFSSTLSLHSVLFAGNITETESTHVITLKMGDGTGADSAQKFTFDNTYAENLVFDAAISEGLAAATTLMIISNTETDVTNTQTFNDTVAVDQIQILAAANVTFNALVTASTSLTSVLNTTYNAGHTGAMISVGSADFNLTFGSASVLTGNIIPGANNKGTLNLLAPTSDLSMVTGTVGTAGSAMLKVLNVNVTSFDTKLDDTAEATTINILQASGTDGTLVFGGASKGAIIISGATAQAHWESAKGHTGSVATAVGGTGTLVFEAGTQNISTTAGATGSNLANIRKLSAGVLTLTGHVFSDKVSIEGSDAAAVTMGSAALLTSPVEFDGTSSTAGITTGTGITGAVTTLTDNTGIITTGADSTFTGSIGAADKRLKTINADHSVTMKGDIHAVNLIIKTAMTFDTFAGGDIYGITTFEAAGVGILNLTDGSNHTGNIVAGTGDYGTVNMAGDTTVTGDLASVGTALLAVNVNGSAKTTTLTGGLHAITTTIAAGATLKFSHATAAAVTGLITATAADTGTIDVGTATVTASSTIGLGGSSTGSTFKVTIGTTDGQLASVSTITTDAKLIIEPTIVGAVVSGESLKIIDSTTGTATAVPTATITDNYARYNFSVARCSTLDLCLTTTIVTPTGVTGNGAAVNKVADKAFIADAAMANALNGLSGAAADKALKTLAPAVDGGAIVGAVSAGGAASNTISTQMASLRNGIAAGQGINAGDGSEDQRFWTQGFGSYAEQKIRQGVSGFTSATGGVAFGVDKAVLNNLRLGGAYSYAFTGVDAAESLNTTNIQSHQATLYGSFDIDRNMVGGADGVFLDAQLSYSYNDYDGNRHIAVGAVERQAKGDYDGYQIGSKIELGRMINTGEFRFTPSVALSHSRVEIDKYTETGATTANLTVEDQSYDILTSIVKAKVARTWQVNGLDLTPEVHVGYGYEYLHEKVQATSSFNLAGTSFKSVGFKTANHSYLGGLGVTYKGLTFTGKDALSGLPPVDLTMTYDFSAKDHFMSHSALVKGTWRF